MRRGERNGRRGGKNREGEEREIFHSVFHISNVTSQGPGTQSRPIMEVAKSEGPEPSSAASQGGQEAHWKPRCPDLNQALLQDVSIPHVFTTGSKPVPCPCDRLCKIISAIVSYQGKE